MDSIPLLTQPPSKDLLSNIFNPAEDVVADDDDDDDYDDVSSNESLSDTDEKVSEYEENSWSNEPEDEPIGFSFKSKKRLFTKAFDNIKTHFKKGRKQNINSVGFKVLNSRNIPHGKEIEMEITKENEKGIALLKMFGPNRKKQCTIVVNNSQKSYSTFASVLAGDIIKPLLDSFISGEGWIKVFNSPKTQIPKEQNSKDYKQKHACKECTKKFAYEKALKNHIEKVHQMSPKEVSFSCNKCEYKSVD